MKVMLIDGNSLTYRAFFALPTDMMTSSGQVTNAVHGFTAMLINLVRDHEPDRVIVTFDRQEPTFRHKMVDTYKAGREAAPDILRQQMGLVRQLVEALGVPVVDKAGFEADDVIATLATRARDRGDDAIIVTGDRDSYQLVEDPHVKVLYNKRGVSDYALYDEAGILERTGVPPDRYVEYAALRGDPSDNLPGVPGVGEKTAAKLIMSYGGIDGIYEHVGEQTPKLQQNLVDHEAQVRSNVEMMVLVRDVDLGVDPEDLAAKPADPVEVKKLFDFLELNKLYTRMGNLFGETISVEIPELDVLEAEVTEVADVADAVAALKSLQADPSVLALAAGWTIPADSSSELDGLAFVREASIGDVMWVPAKLLEDPTVRDVLGSLLGRGARPFAAHDAKAVMRSLLDLDIDIESLQIDTALAAYLLDPAESRYVLDDLLGHYAQRHLPQLDDSAVGQLDFGGTSVATALDGARQALAVAALIEPLFAALDAQGLRGLHDEIEVPLVRVLASMESVGIGVDVARLQALSDEMAAECASLTALIWADAGEEFNVNSTPQLRTILFDKLGLTPQKKTKTGFSTDAASLEKLAGEHPIIEHLLRYREVEKLRSTYGEGLLASVGSDGRIHATFNQTVARTGRLSSDAPNLHNIPVRSEMGRRFRSVFVPGPGFDFLVADYNQIELRCIAHLAEDPGLIAAFESDTDIHTETAARIFSVAPEAVTFEQRSKSKMVSYGLAYGMEAFGLGQRLAISTTEAQGILDAYFVAFPAVRAYMDHTVAEARERGYTETLFGRRRQIPELSSPNFRIRQAGERQAMNAGIQGLAADIFKVALIRLDEVLDREQLRSRVILQVHDEVIIEVPPAERDRAHAVTLESMMGAFNLRVPLAVNLAFGPSWGEAKP
ncbi:MAG: DNA polymerase I [Actinomycetes bacterium]